MRNWSDATLAGVYACVGLALLSWGSRLGMPLSLVNGLVIGSGLGLLLSRVLYPVLVGLGVIVDPDDPCRCEYCEPNADDVEARGWSQDTLDRALDDRDPWGP